MCAWELCGVESEAVAELWRGESGVLQKDGEEVSSDGSVSEEGDGMGLSCLDEVV